MANETVQNRPVQESIKEIISEIGHFHHCIYEKDEMLPGNVLPTTLLFQDYNCVVAGSGSTGKDNNYNSRIDLKT